ncbi:MAG: hypothetical protein ACHQ52_09770, partial [Candidatus Eisenbacteria bacterium]
MSIASGDTALRALTISNTGGSDLHVTLHRELAGGLPATGRFVGSRAARPVPGFGAAPSLAPRSDRRPAGWRAVPTSAVSTPGAGILLIQDAAPWGTSADQQVLNANGLPFDQIPTTLLAYTDLQAYRLVIVASDQPQSAYDTIQGQASQFAAFVSAGGVLEFHAAGWGVNGGSSSGIMLPGGVTIATQFADSNTVLIPTHPAVAGVPSTFGGNYASHAALGALPPGAAVITIDQTHSPTLIEYAYGAGLVIASGQALEFGFATGEATGVILQNLIP